MNRGKPASAKIYKPNLTETLYILKIEDFVQEISWTSILSHSEPIPLTNLSLSQPDHFSEEVLWQGFGQVGLLHFHLVSAFSMFGLAGKYAPQWLVGWLLRSKLSLLTVRQLPAACTIYRRGTNATMQDLDKWNGKDIEKIFLIRTRCPLKDACPESPRNFW